MKVSIIGGAGRVGSDAAYALQFGGIVREIVITDMNEEGAKGEAMDLLHGASLTSDQKIYAGSYDAVSGSDVVIVTAGLRRRPDESRLELINRNVQLFIEILDNLRKTSLADGAILFVVSNPVDILTQLAVRDLGLPSERVFGLGTVLDTARFRSLIADYFQIAPTDVKALILGEHGDTMVPIWSSASINGMSLSSLPGFNKEVADKIFQATKTSGADVIRQKGGAGRAVGVAIKEVVEAIALDAHKVLPVSAYQQGALGIRDVCLSLPTIIGRRGIVQILEPVVSEEEREALLQSSQALQEVWQKVA